MESGQLTTSMIIVFVDNTRTLVNIAPGNFEAVHQLLNAIASAILKIKNQSKLIIAANSSKTYQGNDDADADAEEFEAENLPLIDRSDALQSVRFKFDTDLNRISVFFDDNFIKQLDLSIHLQYLLGFENRFLNKSGNEAMYSPDLKGGIDALYVYCSLCEPQIVGNSMVKLLRIVHVAGDYGTTIEKIFYAPHYVPVIVKNFEHVHIEIKSDTNILIPFESGKTVVKLHFRKRRLVF
jgi:hypothetical protein